MNTTHTHIPAVGITCQIRPTPPTQRPSRAELGLLIAVLGLALLAVSIAVLHGPIAQSAHFHGFADSRHWLNIPHAGDVISNLGFAVMGVLGLRALSSANTLTPLTRMASTTFFCGLLVTFVGSNVYHWLPNDAGLAIDRFAMTIAFAGLLGWLTAVQISERAGQVMLASMLLVGPATVAMWSITGDLGAYAVLQFGGMALTLGLAFAAPHMRKAALGVLCGYVVAKAFEGADHAVMGLTGDLISGHSLKHIAAALAAWPLIAWLRTTA